MRQQRLPLYPSPLPLPSPPQQAPPSTNLQIQVSMQTSAPSSQNDMTCPNCIILERESMKWQKLVIEMKEQLQAKVHQNRCLGDQISELKGEQEYLLRSLQEIQGKSLNESLLNQSKIKTALKSKQEHIFHATKQIEKLRNWLLQQKSEVYRILQCIKAKDMLIDGLEKQIKILKQSKQSKIQKNLETNPKPDQQLIRYRRKCRELQEQVFVLTQEIYSLRSRNYVVSCLGKDGDLDGDVGVMKLLTQKILYLQHQLQKTLQTPQKSSITLH